MGIKDYSSTAGGNTSVGGINIQEGMLPSNINDAFRALTADIREWYNDSQWIIYGDGDSAFTIAYATSTAFNVLNIDVTSFYHIGRRIKAVGSSTGTIYGSITASSYSTNTSVVVAWDSGSLSNETLTIYVGALSKTNSSIPDSVIGTSNIADGSITTAKLASNAVTTVKITDANITTAKIADSNITTAKIADSNITTAKIANDAVTTAKILDANVTTAKIADSSITASKIASDAVTTVKILDSNVTTAKIADDAITTGKIADGTIINADINASAAIAATKIHDGSVSNTEFGYLDGVTSSIQTQINSKLTASNNLSDVSSASTARTNLGLVIGTNVQAYDAELAAIAGLTSAADKGIQFTGSGTAATFDLTTAGKALLDDADASAQRTTLGLGTIATQNANNVSISGGTVTGLGDPSASSEAATKNYVDNLVAGLRTRVVARVASTTNVTIASGLENGDTIDGVTLVTGNKVLLKNQSTASQNGLYTVVASGSASRDTEFDTITELAGQLILVSEGSTQADTLWLCTSDTSATLGSSSITYTQVYPSSGGTVTSVGLADAGSSEFTITNSPVTTSGTINIAVNSIAATKIGTGVVNNTEFGYLDGVTSAIQTQIDSKQATITGGATSITSSNLTASKALVSDGSGKVAVSTVTSTELGYVSGVTSAIQTQIDNKAGAGFTIAMAIAL
jgi:hypothetical protein